MSIATALYDATATPYALLRTPATRGAATLSWPTAGTPFRCKAKPASQRDRMMAGQDQTAMTHLLYRDPGTPFVREDRVHVARRGQPVLVLRILCPVHPSTGEYERWVCEDVAHGGA